MRKIKAVPISNENFAPFGQFYKMDTPRAMPCGVKSISFFLTGW